MQWRAGGGPLFRGTWSPNSRVETRSSGVQVEGLAGLTTSTGGEQAAASYDSNDKL